MALEIKTLKSQKNEVCGGVKKESTRVFEAWLKFMASFIYKKCMECIGTAWECSFSAWTRRRRYMAWWLSRLLLNKLKICIAPGTLCRELSATWYMRVLSHASISHILHLFAVILHCTSVKWERQSLQSNKAGMLAHTAPNIKVKIFFVLSHSIHY